MTRASGSRLEMSAISPRAKRDFLLPAYSGLVSSGPKFRENTICCSSVMGWPGKISTAYRLNAAPTAAKSAGATGSRRSTPAISAPICGCSGLTPTTISASALPGAEYAAGAGRDQSTREQPPLAGRSTDTFSPRGGTSRAWDRPSDHPDAAADRRLADLASQRGLGLLPQQWGRPVADHHRRPAGHWTDIAASRDRARVSDRV